MLAYCLAVFSTTRIAGCSGVQLLHGGDQEIARRGIGGGNLDGAAQSLIDTLGLAHQLFGTLLHAFGGADRKFAGRRGNIAGRCP